MLDRKYSRLNRRVTVGITAVLAAFGTPVTLDPDVPSSASWVLIAVLAALFVFLLSSTRRLAFRSSKHLDERETLVVLQAHKAVYGVLIGLLVSVILTEFMSFRPFVFLRPDISLSLETVAVWVLLLLMAPTMYIAWTEPDPILENEATTERVLS